MGLTPAARTAVRSLLVAAWALAAGADGGAAQSGPGGYGGLVLASPASVEAAAFGNAPYLLGGRADLLFYAPALITRSDGTAAGVHRYGGEGTLATLAGTGSVGLGDFAFGLQYLRYREPGGGPTPELQNWAFAPDGPSATEFAASLGYARELFGGVGAGVVVKYLEQVDFGGGGTNRVLLWDAGVAREFGATMVSLAARNLGPDFVPGDGGIGIPTQLALGVSTRSFEVGEFDVFLTGQLLRRRDGEIIPASGVEVSYWPVQGYTFRLRAGHRRVVEEGRSPFTFGLALTGDALTVAYAFQAFDVNGNAHRFGLSFR